MQSILSVALCFFCVAALASDLKIVTTHKGPGGITSTRTEYIKGPRSRVEWRDVSGEIPNPGTQTSYTYGPRRALIQQCDQFRMLDLNLDTREYIRHELDKHPRPKSVKARTAPPAMDRGSLTIYIDAVDTGERKLMFGRKARHVVTHERRVASPDSCNQSSETEIDGWYIDLDVLALSCTAPVHSKSAVAVLTSGNCLGKLEVHRTGPSELGYPIVVKQTTRSHLKGPDGREPEYVSTAENEVTELSDLPLDAQLFEAPEGFKQVSQFDEHSFVPGLVAVRQWWERLKTSVFSWFG